jgi:hypothetical protein
MILKFLKNSKKNNIFLETPEGEAFWGTFCKSFASLLGP